MAKDPSLSLVRGPHQAMPSPPRTLGKVGQALWVSIMREYAIQDAGGLETLAQAAAAADRAADCAMQIERDGALLMTKSGPRDHPLLRHELANRAFVVRSLVRLGINIEPVRPVGRPGSGGGITWEDVAAAGSLIGGAMPTNRRTSIPSLRTGMITPAAVARYRRLRALDGECTCPPPPAWIPGQNVFVSSDPVCVERERRVRQARDAYEAARALCLACPAAAREHARLLEELRLVLKPWQSGIEDYPQVEAALEAAAAAVASP